MARCSRRACRRRGPVAHGVDDRAAGGGEVGRRAVGVQVQRLVDPEQAGWAGAAGGRGRGRRPWRQAQARPTPPGHREQRRAASGPPRRDDHRVDDEVARPARSTWNPFGRARRSEAGRRRAARTPSGPTRRPSRRPASGSRRRGSGRPSAMPSLHAVGRRAGVEQIRCVRVGGDATIVSSRSATRPRRSRRSSPGWWCRRASSRRCVRCRRAAGRLRLLAARQQRGAQEAADAHGLAVQLTGAAEHHPVEPRRAAACRSARRSGAAPRRRRRRRTGPAGPG